ncbi:hypothetical protein C0J52_28249 [Blattella germanica]|nr:hypothetical protein C0J52_28249 [Blattella germanica]
MYGSFGYLGIFALAAATCRLAFRLATSQAHKAISPTEHLYRNTVVKTSGPETQRLKYSTWLCWWFYIYSQSLIIYHHHHHHILHDFGLLSRSGISIGLPHVTSDIQHHAFLLVCS